MQQAATRQLDVAGFADVQSRRQTCCAAVERPVTVQGQHPFAQDRNPARRHQADLCLSVRFSHTPPYGLPDASGRSATARLSEIAEFVQLMTFFDR